MAVSVVEQNLGRQIVRHSQHLGLLRVRHEAHIRSRRRQAIQQPLGAVGRRRQQGEVVRVAEHAEPLLKLPSRLVRLHSRKPSSAVGRPVLNPPIHNQHEEEGRQRVPLQHTRRRAKWVRRSVWRHYRSGGVLVQRHDGGNQLLRSL